MGRMRGLVRRCCCLTWFCWIVCKAAMFATEVWRLFRCRIKCIDDVGVGARIIELRTNVFVPPNDGVFASRTFSGQTEPTNAMPPTVEVYQTRHFRQSVSIIQCYRAYVQLAFTPQLLRSSRSALPFRFVFVFASFKMHSTDAHLVDKFVSRKDSLWLK